MSRGLVRRAGMPYGHFPCVQQKGQAEDGRQLGHVQREHLLHFAEECGGVDLVLEELAGRRRRRIVGRDLHVQARHRRQIPVDDRAHQPRRLRARVQRRVGLDQEFAVEAGYFAVDDVLG